MSKKNMPTDMPSGATVNESLAGPQVQPIIPSGSTTAAKTENGKYGTPFDSITQFEKAQQVDEAYGAGVWYTNKKVNSLWTKAETRNAWVNLTDLGWKKFFNGSDSSVVAFTILAGQALEKQTFVNLYIENDQIVEMYVW